MAVVEFDHLITETSSIATSAGVADDHKHLIDRLRAAALPEGGVILIAMPNGRHLLKLFFAVLSAGYVPAMLSPTTPAVRVKQMAEDFRAVAIVKPKIGDELRTELLLNRIDKWPSWEVGLFDGRQVPLTQPGEVILSTSGTSSEFSSGCVHAFESLVKNALKHAAEIGLAADDRVLVSLPLYYSFALVAQAIASIELGAQLIISGPPFVPARYIADLEQHDITVSSVTPVLLREVLAHTPGTLPPSLRAVTVGGDFLAPQHAAAFVERFPGKELYLTYGITEAGPRVATGLAHQATRHRLASVGKPMRGIEVRIDSDGPDARTGELLVRSDTLLKRKIGRGARNPLIEIDGDIWLRTGDVFEIDEEGYLFFKHRKSDFVVLNDEKVNLAAIRHFCRSLPGVLSCKTKFRQSNDGVDGYFLEIAVDKLMVGDEGADLMKQQILKGLKKYERPISLTLMHVDRQQHEFYK
ncbi:coronafacic acid synthetase [Burkholderia multivorans]|uniref:class I adenylate-forming enzyme family protein n=1 Tax=Burkholderia multivorans TaxID=87883 RepID=UPI00075898DC|nr:class I adenylate-forming enzyme family protein [Burkholderia multivorans]KWF73739.1 coronafacic acid synthetase [Burkholderia multivorans]KWF73805.1 coronafacic acid synthetase [Burkholderia multivorans]